MNRFRATAGGEYISGQHGGWNQRQDADVYLAMSLKSRLVAAISALLLTTFAASGCATDPPVDTGEYQPPAPGKRGLPTKPGQSPPSNNDGKVKGFGSYQLPILPLAFRVDNHLKISVSATGKLVTPIGTFGLGLTASDGEKAPPAPGDSTQLAICIKDAGPTPCTLYRIDTGRKLRVAMEGKVVGIVERNRITVEASPGAKVKVEDIDIEPEKGPLGPARVDVEEFHFSAQSTDTQVSFESERGGAPDLAYDHRSGSLQPVSPAQISNIKKYAEKKKPIFGEGGISLGDKVPGEDECFKSFEPPPAKTATGRTKFTDADLKADTIIACFKTAQGNVGYMVIGRDRDTKPVTYHIYSHTWIRA